MISCDTCNVWQHTKCIGIKPDASPPLDFLCDACKKKVHFYSQQYLRNQK